MTKTDADIIILGAGCAGLSLACHVARRCPGREVLLLDRRRTYENDRTWCFWSVEPHHFSSIVRHRWSKWAVRRGPGEAFVQRSGGVQYECIPADAFYRRAFDELTNAPNVRVILGCEVLRVRALGSGVEVETNFGRRCARLVFDSRPRPSANGLRQHFVGWEVVTHKPVFDPETATLMDFEPHAHGLHFTYVLPFASDRALVEDTFVDSVPPNLASEHYRHNLRAYLRRRYQLEEGQYVIRRQEAGVIPMTAHAATTATPIPIGLLGGAARPSSGYAFAAIQRVSAAWANRLGLSLSVPSQLPRPRVPFLNAMDRILLRLLEDRPQGAERLFVRLFEATEPTALARFLSDVPRWGDYWQVTRALPARTMLEAARRAWRA